VISELQDNNIVVTDWLSVLLSIHIAMFSVCAKAHA